MGSSTGRARSSAVSSPPTMNASVPATAPRTPPETGASSCANPCESARACTSRASLTEMVELSMNSAPRGGQDLGVATLDHVAVGQHGDHHVGVGHGVGRAVEHCDTVFGGGRRGGGHWVEASHEISGANQ